MAVLIGRASQWMLTVLSSVTEAMLQRETSNLSSSFDNLPRAGEAAGRAIGMQRSCGIVLHDILDAAIDLCEGQRVPGREGLQGNCRWIRLRARDTAAGPCAGRLWMWNLDLG